MPIPRLMCVHAHPDDESLWTGGVIARHVELGGEVSVVVGTWATGTPRHGELVNALTELGVTSEPIVLDYADDAVPESAPGRPRFAEANFDEQVRLLVTHIRRLRPEIIVTYDPVGIYGHRDHVHANRLACAAADAASVQMLYRSVGEPWQVRSLYFVTIPETIVDEIADEMFAGVPRRALPGTPSAAIDLELDVSAWVGPKAAAIAAHRTEVARSRTIAMLMSLPQAKLDRLLGTESYVRRDLVPGGADL